MEHDVWEREAAGRRGSRQATDIIPRTYIMRYETTMVKGVYFSG
jgi:hypothetical protein